MDTQCRLRPLGGGQFLLLRVEIGVGEHRLWEYHVVQALAVERQVGGCVPCFTGRIEGHRHFGAHADILAALAGEEEGQLPGVCCAGRIVHAGRAAVSRSRRFFDGTGGLVQLFDQLGGACSNHGQTCRIAWRKGKLRFARDVAKLGLGSCHGAALGDQFRRAGRTE